MVEYSLTAERTSDGGVSYTANEDLKLNPYIHEELERDATRLIQRNPKRKSVEIKVIEDN